jgi:hypothetical protein
MSYNYPNITSAVYGIKPSITYDITNEKNALACVLDGRLSMVFRCGDCTLV